MKYVGVDLHKKVISVCVVMQTAGHRIVTKRETLRCGEPQRIQSWFRRLGTFQVTVEATSSYEWFISLWNRWPTESCWPIPRSCG